MKITLKTILPILTLIAAASCSDTIREATVTKDTARDQLFSGKTYTDFDLTGEALLEEDACAGLTFHATTDNGSGYEILFHNGPIDGTRKTGSLASVRNLYRSLASDGEWFPFEIAVRGKNISVKIKGTDVVCYTEPENPYRTEAHAAQLLGSGHFILKGYDGTSRFRNLKVTALKEGTTNPCDTLPPVDEQNDEIIRLQQQDFPVIDWHVHAKGGLTMEAAHALSMNYGINYGVGPNAYGPMTEGEGGYGTMYTGDDDLGEYYETVKDMPFLRGVQGEGRKWSYSFSDSLLSKFDYLYTDAMTIVDHKGRLTRTYRPEEVIMDIPADEYMKMLVNQMEKILTEEPADIFANAFYIPDTLSAKYDEYWNDTRIERILKVMKHNGIALEISARYQIPGRKIIKKAKEMGLKFTFGTNNMGTGFGRLEYCTQMIKECGITPQDMWYPVMSTRSARNTASTRGPIKTVIITGQNNHNWPVSHIALEKILTNSGLFTVDQAVSPEQGGDFSGFNVDFDKYELVVMDYNGDSWNDDMNAAFVRFVRNGGGVVIYHAADNAFSGWEEFNKIIALGGWENRDENSGPYVYWKDGALVKDFSPGPGGSHGEQHEYVMECRSQAHPIIKGLPARWKHAKDELYDSMRGPGNIGELLYTAYAPVEKRGSGRTEPLIFTVAYGNGRIFHIMTGHAGATLEDNPAMQCAGFQTLLLRGAQWAATGIVTQPVPADFPTADKVSYRLDYK